MASSALEKLFNCPLVVSAHENFSACKRVSDLNGALFIRSVHPLRKEMASRCCINTPAVGVLTTSGVPQMLVAITGVPQAMASNSTLAQPSRLEHSVSASAALYHHFSSVCGTTPAQCTRSVTPRRLARALRAPSSGPEPAMSSVTPGKLANASMAMWWPLRSMRWPTDSR